MANLGAFSSGAYWCNYSRIYLLINMMIADAIEALNTHQRRINEQLPPRQMVGKPRFKARPGASGNGSSVMAPKAYELNRASGHISAGKHVICITFCFISKSGDVFLIDAQKLDKNFLDQVLYNCLILMVIRVFFFWGRQHGATLSIKEADASSTQELLQWVRSINISSPSRGGKWEAKWIPGENPQPSWMNPP